MSKIFGGSKQKSKSYNTNNDFLKGQLGGATGLVGQAGNSVAALLGLGGDVAGQTAAFNNYKDSAGFKFLANEGTEDILGNAAARGLLRSGSTGEALTSYRMNLANTFLDNYIKNSLGVGQLGLGASGVLADTGRVSEQSSKSKPGIGKFLGTALAAVAAPATGGASLAAIPALHGGGQ